jgi:hypothetical protein
MLPTTMAKLQITSPDLFDIFVLIQDLNTVGEQKGARLKQGKTLSVHLEEDQTGNVSYHWAAEQIVEGPAYHDAHLVKPTPVAAGTAISLSISLQANGQILPFMFRPYP